MANVVLIRAGSFVIFRLRDAGAFCSITGERACLFCLATSTETHVICLINLTFVYCHIDTQYRELLHFAQYTHGLVQLYWLQNPLFEQF